MSDAHDAFDGPSDSAPLAPELAALIERIETDALLWETHAPAHDGRLAAYARELAGEATRSAGGVVLLERPILDGDRSGGIRSAAPRQPRTGRVLAYVSALVVVALIAVSLAIFHRPTTTIPTSTPAATVTAANTVTPTAPVTPQPTATAVPTFQVTRIIGGTSPGGWTDDRCQATMPFTLDAEFGLATNMLAGTITYRWHRSDGYVSQHMTLAYTPGRFAVTSIQSTTWDIPYNQGDGADKWVAIEVMSPNPMMSDHFHLQLTCQFVPDVPSSTVSPQYYHCPITGDETFDFSGVITGTLAPGAHTVTYHWERSDGTRSQDYTATLPQGITSVPAQPDSWTIPQGDLQIGKAHWEEIVATAPDPPGQTTPGYQTYITPSC